MNSMPPLKRSLALSTPWSQQERPTRTSVSDTTTVSIDASVRVTLRMRLVAVSRAT